MKYDSIKEESEWRERAEGKSVPLREQFAHECVHSRWYDTLVSLGCDNSSSILELGCGSGDTAIYVGKACKNIVGADISLIALKKFTIKGFQGILADVKNLPFHSNSFDYVIAPALLHHLIGQGELIDYLAEFVRVTKEGGHVIASEPNSFHPSGILMNIFNQIKPGITDLVPYERALSPLYLAKVFNRAGLKEVNVISASYAWNRFPLFISKFTSKHEDRIRFRKPFNLLGWFTIVYGKKRI